MIQATAYAKCILLGEHSVLRGVPALIVPCRRYQTTCHYRQSSDPLSITINGFEAYDHLRESIFFLIKRLQTFLGVPHILTTGHLEIHNTIPTASGLGSSAALCVGLCDIAVALGELPASDRFECAMTLEHQFHATSSGVDVAACLEGRAIVFQEGSWKPFTCTWLPYIYLSHVPKILTTAECVRQVQQWHTEHSKEGAAVDEMMREAVGMACTALSSDREEHRFEQLLKAFELGAHCFESWSLISPEAKSLTEKLKSEGARAVKPTGSGGGGHLISLWDRQQAHMIELFCGQTFKS